MRKSIEKQLAELNREIKDSLEPGEHTIGQYKANITLKRKFNIDEYVAWKYLDSDTLKSCERVIIDPDLVESAYLRGDITDDILRMIRGKAQLIPTLTVEEIGVQAEL